MLFNSFEFIFLFLPIAVIGFFGVSRVRHELGTAWLVLASLFFYGWWDYRYVPLLLGSILFNYLVGQRLERLAFGHEIERGGHVTADMPHHGARKAWLAFGIVLNVALLGYFKYTDFFLGTWNALAGAMVFDLPHIVLPLGISFFTFTQTAYLVDAYRGQARTPSLVAYGEFVTIFPHLIAGPIINHKKMMPQFVAEETFHVNWANLSAGLTLFVLGLFKKVCLADTISPWVNAAFAQVDGLTCLAAWAAVIGYTLQLYFDFSGYSEMALGLGLMLNLRLPQNFDSPYQARSIIDFWRRWHITLGLWVRDYLYIPMGGNRFGKLLQMRNLFISMLIIGLWHGAGWTYVLWGAWHGVMLMVNHAWRGLGQHLRLQNAQRSGSQTTGSSRFLQLPNPVCWLFTMAGVVIGWVFFRAADFHTAGVVFVAMADLSSLALDVDAGQLAFLAACAVAALTMPNPVRLMEKFRPSLSWLLLTIALGLLALSQFSHVTDFLYFQF